MFDLSYIDIFLWIDGLQTWWTVCRHKTNEAKGRPKTKQRHESTFNIQCWLIIYEFIWKQSQTMIVCFPTKICIATKWNSIVQRTKKKRIEFYIQNVDLVRFVVLPNFDSSSSDRPCASRLSHRFWPVPVRVRRRHCHFSAILFLINIIISVRCAHT